MLPFSGDLRDSALSQNLAWPNCLFYGHTHQNWMFHKLPPVCSEDSLFLPKSSPALYIPSVHPFEKALHFSELWSAAFWFPDLPCAHWRASPPPADHWLLVIPDPLQVRMQPHLKIPQERACPFPSLFRSEGTHKAVFHYNKWLEQVQHILLLHLTHS